MFPTHPTKPIIEDCWQECFQDSVNFCSFNILTKSTITGDLLQANVLRIFDSRPWLLHHPILDFSVLNLAQPSGTTARVPFFLSTLHEYYSGHHKIYIDGSKTASLTGCGIYVEQLNIHQSITINPSFSAELFGILRALYCVFIYAIPKVLIITGSLGALQSVGSGCWTTHVFASKIVLMCSTLAKAGREIVFMWVPDHRGIPGNEIADSLAKMATSDNRGPDVGQVSHKTVSTCVSFADICQHLRAHYDHVWNARYQSDPKGTSYKAIYPRRRKEDLRLVQEDTATLFLLRTGHCKLHLYLFRLGLHPDGLCDVCKIPETVSHFLLICPKFRAQRETLLASLRNMGVNINIQDVLRHSDASRLVQLFVDETHRTIWSTDEPKMRRGAKRPVMLKRKLSPPYNNNNCFNQLSGAWQRLSSCWTYASLLSKQA